MTVPDASTYPELYSAIILGTRRSPGVVTLTGHNREENWDVQAAKGSEGSSSVLNGRGVGSFQAAFYLVDEPDPTTGRTDFDEWEDFQRLIESTTATDPPTALPVYHPDLAANHFTEVSNGGVGGLVRDGKGGAIVQVKFIEYKPPRPRTAAQASGRNGGAGGVGAGGADAPAPYDPNAAAKRELDALLDEAGAP